ncbi:MAG: ASCH domain-containing protein [Acidimicrobiia bacterium]
MTEEAVDAFWNRFVSATGIDGPYEAWAFGDDSRPELATQLALLVRDGPKRATAGLAAEYQQDNEPPPQVGDMSVILDGSGTPVCVIRTTEVRTTRLGDVDEAFAWDEGEGDRSLAWWKDAHIRFFADLGFTIDDDSEMMLERFELLWSG